MLEISPDDGREVLEFLSGEYVVDLCDGAVRLYCTDLPADTVSAAVQDDEVLHVFMDLRKPSAPAHCRQMLREWLNINCPIPLRTVPLQRVGQS